MEKTEWEKGTLTVPQSTNVDWETGDFAPRAEPPARGFKGWARDIAATAVKGAIAVPEAVVGLADIPTGGAVGKFLENEGGAVGFRPKQAREAVNDWHSEATKEAQRKFQAADGLVDKAATAIQNPSLIATAVGESVPSMLAGGVAARGLMAATRLGARAAGALGEGITGAGSAAEQIRQETPDGLLNPLQAGAAVATGVTTAGFSALGGKVAQKLGIGDAETMLAQGQKGMQQEFADTAAKAAANPLVQQQAAKSIPLQVIEGAISEGFLEELPQSVAEQVFQNLALGKDWMTDVDSAVVMGVLSGGAMGGAAAGYHGVRAPGADPAQVGEGAPPAQGEPLAPGSEQPASPGLDRVREAYSAQLQALQQQEQGEPVVAQSTPPDGAAILQQQRAQEQAQRQADIDASRAVASPDDEIYQSTGAAEVRPSVQMGIDPAAGPLSAGAAIAVDSGVSDQVQQASALAQAAEQAKKGGAKAAVINQKEEQPALTQQAPDPETGEISQPDHMAAWSDAQLSESFRGAQSRDVRMQLAQELSRRRTQREQQALQDELAVEQNAPDPRAPGLDAAFASVREDAGMDTAGLQAPVVDTTPGKKSAQAIDGKALAAIDNVANQSPISQGAVREPQADQTQQAATQPAQAGAAPAVESREQRAQRVAQAGVEWARMPAAERQALAQRSGLKVIVQKNVHRAQWDDLHGGVQRQLADAMAPAKVAMDEVRQFSPETGTLGVPRAEMPQVPTQSHGGLVKHLNAQGIAHETTTLDAGQLKPTQAEYSPAKVEAAKTATGDRAVIVSSDGHIIDGHHQAMAAAEDGKPVKAIVLDAPVEQALEAVKNSPSAQASAEVSAAPKKPRGILAKKAEAEEKARADYFSPGNIVKSYGGHDRVVSYTPPDAEGRWSVTVRQVRPQDGKWMDVQGLRERTHATQPDARELKAGPVQRAQGMAPATPVVESGAPADRITDFGEKIGGARKDQAASKDAKAARPRGADDRPAWARRFEISQIAKSSRLGEEGRWSVRDLRSLDSFKQPRRVGRDTYATREEAERAVPLLAVSQKHRVVPVRGDGAGYEIWRDVSDRKRVKVVEQVFPTREAALEHMASNAQAIIETNTTFGEADLPQPPSDARTGTERRTGDARDSDFMDVFGFRGVEFGNWNNQKERQQLLNDAYDGLLDLAEVMDVPPRAISLDGDLALAFGARGHGLSSARAHYEPGKAVINLTKMNGAGSLAHEWFHALDHYFGRQDGKAPGTWVVGKDGTRSLEIHDAAENNMASGGTRGARSGMRPELRDAFTDVMRTIARKAEAYVEDTARADKFVASAREEVKRRLDSIRADLARDLDAKYYKRYNKAATGDQLVEFDSVAEKIVAGESLDLRVESKDTGRSIASGIRWTNDALNRLSAVMKAVRGRQGFSADQDGPLDRLRGLMQNYSARLKMLADAQGSTEKSRAVPTDFIMNAKELDQGRGQDYWTQPHELAARAFQGYVEDKIAEKGGQSPFLNYGPETAAIPTPWGFKRPFPAGEERKAINRSIDKLVEVIQTREGDDGRVALFRSADSEVDADANGFDVDAFLSVMDRSNTYSETAKRQAVESVSATVDAIRAAWGPNAPEVVVAFDMQDPAVPEAVRRADLRQRSGGAAGAPEGFYYSGKAYLMASRVTNRADATRVLYHEVLGHHGLRGKFGKELDAILNQVATMRKTEVAAKMQEYGLRGVNSLSVREAAEEVLAEMAEKNPQLSFVRRAVAAIRNFLRAHAPGFRNLRMTDDDIIHAYILPARGYVTSSKETPEQSLQRAMMAFSRDTTEAMTNKVVVGNQGGRSADDSTPGVRAARQIIEAIAQDSDFADYALRVIPGEFEGKIEPGDDLPVSQQWVDGDMTDEPLEGTSAARIRNLDEKSVLEALQNLGALGKNGPNGYYFGDRVVLIKGESIGSGEDVGESIIKDAEVVGVWKKPSKGLSEIQPNESAAPTSDGAMFSRASMGSLKASAMDEIHKTLTHPGKVSLWDKTVGTMRHLGERAPAFKPVFESAQRFIDDVSTLANDAADVAPRLLPRVETLADLKKKPMAAADNAAIAKPIFEGTLSWARDVDGKPMLVRDLEQKYANLPAEKKAQILLASGRLDAEVLKMWQGLPVAQYEAAINSQFESKVTKAGVVWEANELREMFGLNDQQVSLYQEARAAIDRSIDMTARADMLRALGTGYAAMRDAVLEQPDLRTAMELITRTLQDDAKESPESADRLMAVSNSVVDRYEKATELMDFGYAPLSRFGQYTLDVVDTAGERQYFGMFESAREANVMKAKMAGLFPGATITQGTMSASAFKLFQGVTPESLEMFGNMLGLDGKGDTAQDKAFQEYLRLAKNNHSALKRLIHRKGIAGYSEDVGRVLASFVYSNARLAAAGLNAGTLENAIEAIPKDQGELRDVAMGLRSYIQDPQEEGQAVRGMLFAQYLGGSLASAMVNMTQPFAVTLPWLSQFGGMKKAGAQMARAMRDMSAKGKSYEPDLARALQLAQDDGVVSPQEVHQLMAQARGAGALRSGDGTKMGDARAAAANSWERTKVLWGQPFALAEQFNRRATFIAAYRLAKEQGQSSPAEFARRAVLETQFLYSKANKGRFMRGAVGGTLMTFKTYSVSYLELMQRTWNAGAPGSPERAAGRRAVGWALAMLMLMGGAGGLPFLEDVEDLADGIGQLMGYNLSVKQWRKEALRDVVGKELAEFMEQGISGLPGAPIDVSGRLGMGNLIPGTGLLLTKQSRDRDLLEIAGPAGDLVSRGFTGARKLLTGDVGGAALEVSPTAVRNVAKGADMAATGMYRDQKGYKVIDTTLDEAIAKAVGFQPKAVAEVQEANSFMQRSKSFYTQTSSEIKAQWAQALFEKDEAALQHVRDRLSQWNEDNPEQRIVVKMPDVWKKVREMGKDRTQRIADTAPKALRNQLREVARENG